MTTEYLSCAETAKILREALKESFPGVKFGVRSKTYAGGASITVRWTDGPAASLVKGTVGWLAGGYFDGMIDYAGSRYHKLDGKLVHFGAKYLFFERELSEEARERVLRRMAMKYGAYTVAGEPCEAPTSEDLRMGRGWNVFATSNWNGNENSWSSLFHREAAKVTDRMTAEPSATLARVEFAGDDGYGAGTVGRYGTGRDCNHGYMRASA